MTLPLSLSPGSCRIGKINVFSTKTALFHKICGKSVDNRVDNQENGYGKWPLSLSAQNVRTQYYQYFQQVEQYVVVLYG
jgi:hypothetical protein